MSELTSIEKISRPNTTASLIRDLKALGLQKGDVVIAHASLSALGWIAGREMAVIDALLAVLEPEGTLIMPSQSGENSDPQYWENPPVPESWWEEIRANMPPFDPDRTPTRAMGKIVDALLSYPGRIRSNHPQVSFCGVGPLASEILADHVLSPGLGKGSPLQKLYDHQAKILLLGVGYGNCTSLHLPESQLDNVSWYQSGASVSIDGKAQWISFEEIEYDDDDFEALGNDYEKIHQVCQGYVGAALCRYIDMQELCDFGLNWLKQHRGDKHGSAV